MAEPIKLKKVDIVIIGMGWSGGILASELAQTGLKIVGLERGPDRSIEKDFALPAGRDELKFQSRHFLAQDVSRDTVAFRNRFEEEALPIRKLGSFFPGEGLGGAGLHWNGQTWRMTPPDHLIRKTISDRYGEQNIPAEMTIQDWPISFEELEPYYDRFEKLCGISGVAGNLKGVVQKEGNPFEGPRTNPFPNPPLKPSYSNMLFEQSTRSLGFHPFPAAAANMSQDYVNPDGVKLSACQYCGFCERFGCAINAKASPNDTVLPIAMRNQDFDLRTNSWVNRLLLDQDRKKAVGVIYTDVHTGIQYEQPADLVFVCSYSINNVHLLLLSGIGTAYDPLTGTGQVGRNYCYQVALPSDLFFEDRIFNPFMGSGGLLMAIDDFNIGNEKFNSFKNGFLGGGFISNATTGGRPISTRPVPNGTPKWGTAWKQATKKWYLRNMRILIHASNYAHRWNYLSLDPAYKNVFGDPLLRMTYNFTDNDKKLSQFMVGVVKGIIEEMKPTTFNLANPIKGDYSSVPYQSTHNTGGAICGSSANDSVVNKYCQSWNVDNLFVLGASAFPQNSGYNPTGLVGAQTFLVAEKIKNSYLKPGGQRQLV